MEGVRNVDYLGWELERQRAALWAHDLLMDYEEIEYLLDHKKLLGQKGTTGTQASFMELFEGDEGKVLELEPDNILILRARCPTVATTNRYRRQIEDLSRLLELDPDHRSRYLEARAYRRHWTGDEQGALQDLRDALSEEPGLWRRSVDFRTLWEKFGLTETDAGNFQG